MSALFRRLCDKTLKSVLQNNHFHDIIRCLSTTRNINANGVYLVDEDSSSDDNTDLNICENVNKYTNRTHTCGELRSADIGNKVVLCGWLEYHRMNKFLVLRDSYGQTQILIKASAIKNLLENSPLESIIQVEGTVLSRPEDMFNKKQPTGEIEVDADKVVVLNKAKNKLPFNIREFQKANETLRMQYRYLDIRFPQMQRNLRVRSQVLMKMREFLVNNHFVDVETPTLFKATPGGAQEFIVPTRFPNKFYSLVQSPQQFKQMLMAGAIDRYFQIARCYRDEGGRPDRQPEFTQLDIEMSFTNIDGIIKLIEELMYHSCPSWLGTVPKKFPRISYVDAIEEYGTDKPDIRFEYKLQNCTNVLDTLNHGTDTAKFGAYFLIFPKEHAISLTKSVKDNLSKLSKQYPQSRLSQMKINGKDDLLAKLTKQFSKDVAHQFLNNFKVPEEESVVFLAYGNKTQVLTLLGKIRLEYVNILENLGVSIRKKGMHFVWILDFPLFECSEENGELQSAHHPFTSPNLEDLQLLKDDPLKVRALAYDLVLNGNEVGGGSIRIHDPVLQNTILDMLKIDVGFMQHILDMLGSGCPPHGGIALGLDRFLAVLLGASSIRDVIAFPKTSEGNDPVSGAPAEVSQETKKLYHIESNIKQS